MAVFIVSLSVEISWLRSFFFVFPSRMPLKNWSRRALGKSFPKLQSVAKRLSLALYSAMLSLSACTQKWNLRHPSTSRFLSLWSDFGNSQIYEKDFSFGTKGKHESRKVLYVLFQLTGIITGTLFLVCSFLDCYRSISSALSNIFGYMLRTGNYIPLRYLMSLMMTVWSGS
mgnify:FL=1